MIHVRKEQGAIGAKLLRYVHHHKKDKTITIKIIYTHTQAKAPPPTIATPHVLPYALYIYVLVCTNVHMKINENLQDMSVHKEYR